VKVLIKNFFDGGIEHSFSINPQTTIPRVGEELVIEGEHYTVMEILWDLDQSQIELTVSRMARLLL